MIFLFISAENQISQDYTQLVPFRATGHIYERDIMHDEQIGFKKDCRTVDHIFKLKTLLSKYFKSNKKIYASFIDLQKAFDSVVHPALLHKLLTYGIGGKFYNNMIASMYENTVLQIKTRSAILSKEFWLLSV